DVLLPDVEEGRGILIGATTQNPFFAINSPLLSRSQIFTFEPLTRDAIKTLLRRAPADRRRGLSAVAVRRRRGGVRLLAGGGERRRRAAGADSAGGRRAVGGEPAGGIHAGGGARLDPAQGPGLRRDGRRPLRRGERVHQEHARLGPGRGGLLAGADAGGGRG